MPILISIRGHDPPVAPVGVPHCGGGVQHTFYDGLIFFDHFACAIIGIKVNSGYYQAAASVVVVKCFLRVLTKI